MFGFVGFLLIAPMFLASSAAYLTLSSLAIDLDKRKTIAGSDEVTEIARTVTNLGDGLFFLVILVFAIGLVSFGTLILRAKPSTEELGTADGTC